ncbi:hypothetical protein SAMN05444159_7592 [Bradyrhizobium lablabi]|uniref:Uncharacterized protein n=1 Tax=Bradyrhizobium lablabi TaxID=722472 RepID=A0A1M7FSR4_9BRAD|nr:hypothetical protein [Bradyrhizobium lablabi]SHM07063.1 hypothetical protein SAMN05444159_7592 [Bradyrhizobium lablabi]
MKKHLAISLAAALCATPALAQTSPNLTFGQVLTPAQWNSILAGKQDVLSYNPLNVAGGVMLGRLVTVAPPFGTTAGFNLAPGTTPPSPVNGDMWVTAAGIFAQVNGVTVGPLGGASSASFAATQPLAVTFPGGVTTYALNFNSSLLKDGSNNLGINLANPNTWTATQTFPAASITNSELANSSITIGSTNVALGGTAATIAGLTLTAPNLGAATATTINKLTITPPATGSTLTIADGKTYVVNNSITLAGTDNTTWTGAGVNMTLAALNIADQVLTGGANVTAQSQSTGNITVDCGSRPIQTITNNGAYTITAPSNDGFCLLKVTNGASAGATTFTGFSVGTNTGDGLTTTNGNKFVISIIRAGGDSTYSVKALQ